MKTIYKHQGHNSFDKTMLEQGIQEHWNDAELDLNKIDTALWASPYNKTDVFTWEDFIQETYGLFTYVLSDELLNTMAEQFPIAMQFCDLEEALECLNSPMDVIQDDIRIKSYMGENGCSFDEAYAELSKLCETYIPVYFHEIQSQFRDNAFYFVVDEEKILQASEKGDIDNYLISGNKKSKIDYDRIRNDGYAGLEVSSNVCYFGSPFRSWDCDSISVWDANVITVIDREIANISRLANEAPNYSKGRNGEISIFDLADSYLNLEYLYQWVQDNQEKVVDAVQIDILSQEDIQKFVNMVVEERTTRSQINEAQCITEPIEIEQEEFDKTLE